MKFQKGTSQRARILRSVILTGFLLVLAILAIRDQTPFPDGTPQNRYWTDNIVDFLASYKEVTRAVFCLRGSVQQGILACRSPRFL